MADVLVPIALSSQIDQAGDERIHAAKYQAPQRASFVPPVHRGVIFNAYSNTLTVFNADTNAVEGTVALEGTINSNINSNIQHAWVTADGRTAYATKRSGIFHKINLDTCTVDWTAARGFENCGFVINSSETKAYIGRGAGSLHAGNELVILDLATQVYTSHSCSGLLYPWNTALNEADNCVYVGCINLGDFTMARHDLASHTVTANTSNAGHCGSSGRKFYYLPSTQSVYAIGNSGAGVLRLHKDTLATVQTIASGHTMQGMIPSPDGQTIYFVEFVSGSDYNITKWDVGTNTSFGTVLVTRPIYPGMYVSSDGTRLYVTISNFTPITGTPDYTSVINTATMTEIAQIASGANPTGIHSNL
jgi:hypothetical protein